LIHRLQDETKDSIEKGIDNAAFAFSGDSDVKTRPIDVATVVEDEEGRQGETHLQANVDSKTTANFDSIAEEFNANNGLHYVYPDRDYDTETF